MIRICLLAQKPFSLNHNQGRKPLGVWSERREYVTRMSRRRRRRRKQQHFRPQRDVSTLTKRRRTMLRSPKKELLFHENQRLYRPDDDFREVDGTRATVQGTDRRRVRKGILPSSLALQFKNPRRVMVCRRRAERRQTLFKIGKIGKGKKGPVKRKITEKSKVRC